MDFMVLTEGSEDVSKDFTNDELVQESITSTLEKQCESKGELDSNTNSNLSAPDFNFTIHLLEKENKIMEYKLTFKSLNERAFRIYEVENLVIGKPVEYLYKNTILNIIRNKVLQHLPKNFKVVHDKNIVEAYKNELNDVLQK